MPEYDVTHLVEEVDCGMLSGSVAELGPAAGRITWNNSLQEGRDRPLVTEDQMEELRSYFADYGAWDEEEIAGWTLEDMNGMVVQEAASNVREMEAFDTYEEYQEAAERGSVSGQLWKDENGKWWAQFSR